ncbi:MAG: hypothetical protein ITG02_10750 [Patulibacter sp.]|nr:hypothetical protein [Patulibacter sp.]
MPIARPEYGPSLAEVAGPRFRRLPPLARWGGLAVAVLVILLVAVVWVARGESLTQTVIEGPLTFNTRYDDRIERVEAGPGELLRLATKPGPGRGEESLVFRDAGPAPTQDEPAGGPVAQLALRMAGVMRPVREELADSFRVRSEGRVKIGRDYAGWLVRYQFRRDGTTWYGVRALLLPDESGTTERVLDMSLQSEKSDVVQQISEAGSNGPMRTPFYGVAFGTEKPGS